jgi:uncharacterized protein
MIIDAHLHVGEYGVTVENLLRHMDKPLSLAPGVRCDAAVAQNLVGRNPTETKSYEEQMTFLVNAVKANKGRIFGMMTLNPYFEVEEGLRVADRHRKEGTIQAVKLHPRIHNFRVNEEVERLGPIMEWAAKTKTLVHIHTGDPFSEPSRIEPLAESYRDVNLVMCHMATQMVSYTPEAFYVLKHNPNTYLEIGFHEKRLREGVTMLGPGRFLFATDSPINDIGTGLALVHSLKNKPPFGIGLSDDGVESILYKNAVRLNNISLT